MIYAWIAIAVIALALEILTRRLIALWAVPAALVSLILSVCEVSPVYQIIVFLGLSCIGVALAFLFVKKEGKEPLQAVIGASARVTERIDNEAGCGQVCIDGQFWAARSMYDTDLFEAGDAVRVVAREGVKLICKK